MLPLPLFSAPAPSPPPPRGRSMLRAHNLSYAPQKFTGGLSHAPNTTKCRKQPGRSLNHYQQTDAPNDDCDEQQWQDDLKLHKQTVRGLKPSVPEC
eukprot:scaffold67132_cov18-Tisochrysis_lutea.AAC.4